MYLDWLQSLEIYSNNFYYSNIFIIQSNLWKVSASLPRGLHQPDKNTSACTSHEPAHDKTNKIACAPSEDSDQSGHSPSLISLRCALSG